VLARLAALNQASGACSAWSLGLQLTGLDTTAIFGATPANPFALVLTDGSGVATGCINITNAIVGNQIDPPTRKVRRDVRR